MRPAPPIAILLLGCVDRYTITPTDGGAEASIRVASQNATLVTEVVGVTGTDTTRATNGVRGGGDRQGSLDVYSLDYSPNSSLTFSLPCVLRDRPGNEIAVFENAFTVNEDYTFMDPVVVEGSSDGVEFVPFAHSYRGEPGRYSARAQDWQGFAGVHPVLLNVDNNAVDPFSSNAGGDTFDLATLALYEIRFLRLVPAPLRNDPRTGAPYPRDSISNGPDIDGVYVRCDGQ